MSAPTAPVALRYYQYLGYGGPLADQDAANGYAASKEATAACAPLELAGAIAADRSMWSDPSAAPDELIANMAMRRGLRGRHGQSIQRLRERLENPPAAADGSSDAIAEAVRGVLIVPGAYVSVTSNYHPIDGATPGHTTVTVDPDDAAGVSLDQIQVAAEQGAPGWIVIHAVIAEGATIDELTGDIDDYTGPINEL